MAIVWKKSNLPKSDAQQPTPTSNATCNLRLSQAGYSVNGSKIDQTTYFRNHVFNDCMWNDTTKGEETHITANLIINHVDCGQFTLHITHELHREANQDNVTTILHWGNALSEIQRVDITGKDLTLDKSTDNIFTINIQ